MIYIVTGARLCFRYFFVIFLAANDRTIVVVFVSPADISIKAFLSYRMVNIAGGALG
jgi:hypothetical protein